MLDFQIFHAYEAVEKTLESYNLSFTQRQILFEDQTVWILLKTPLTFPHGKSKESLNLIKTFPISSLQTTDKECFDQTH